MWDQTAALEAHKRLSAGRVHHGAKAPDPDETPLPEGNVKPHLCQHCGTTEAAHFDGRNKSSCTKCRTRRFHSLKASAAALVKRGRKK